MKNETPQLIFLKDYLPPAFLIETVNLDIKLHPSETLVRAKLVMRPLKAGAVLKLDLDDITPREIRINGESLKPDEYQIEKKHLVIPQTPAPTFNLETVTVINPAENTQLSGLYLSDGIFCTQCEAEGFRRITPYLDRPGVLATFTTRIEADKAAAPILLGNGNKIDGGELANGRHFAVWHDPFPKPAYLFALVGGRLAGIKDTFTTMSGHKVALEIYVEPGKENRCGWAMESLKRSMKWDETAFGREYDLDIFMIVAVSNFTFGAMENKGLNIFNDKLLLANPDTATDKDYERIEAVIAHEYFHNWTGNRITCRDWFQLCLKEGFTVFRDQEFTSDIHSRPVKRIEDVQKLRNTQFVEDASPLAHPVRPNQYREINNFYTTTIYEKGAELIRMLKILLGAENFRAGCDLYFYRFDGQAVTMEDFISCMEEAGNIDLSQFMRWYAQAGTPEIRVEPDYDEASGIYTLNCRQSIPPTPGQNHKEPHVIPILLGLLGKDGQELKLQDEGGHKAVHSLIILDKAEQDFRFKVEEKPLPSLLRNFSAPVRLKIALDDDELLRLARYDSDPFNRWQALQELSLRYLLPASQSKEATTALENVVEAFGALLHDGKVEPGFRALSLQPPTELDICRELGKNVDPQKVFDARKVLQSAMCAQLNEAAERIYRNLDVVGSYQADAASFGRRSLRNTLLKLLTCNNDEHALAIAEKQLQSADNLTDRYGALISLCQNYSHQRDQALKQFEARYSNEPLVLDKWFTVQALDPYDSALDTIEALTHHPVFSWKTPNRVYALLYTFAQSNLTQFHREDGEGYRYIADCILKLELLMPQVGARLMTSFRSISWLEQKRRAFALEQVKRIASHPNLSSDVADLSTRLLVC